MIIPRNSLDCEYIIHKNDIEQRLIIPCRAEKATALSSSLNMKRRTITNAVITAFIVIMHNNDSNGMAVNWKHNTDILRGEKHAIPKIVEIPMVDTIEKVIVTLDYGTIEREVQGLQAVSKLSSIHYDHHQPQIQKMQHRLRILKQQIFYLQCDNKSVTQEQNERARRSTFVSSLFGVATEGDLQIAKGEIKKTQQMMSFLISHESSFTRNIESLMEGEESLSERNQELSGLLYKQMKEATLVLMADETDKLLNEAEEAFYSYTGTMPNEIIKVVSRYGIGLNQDQAIRPHGCTKLHDSLVKLEFNLIKTKRIKAKFLNHQTVQIGQLLTIMQKNDQQAIIECMWTSDLRCVGRAIRHKNILTARGMKNVTLSVRTTNQQSHRQCEATNEELETNCRTKSDFNARSVIKGFLTTETGGDIQCQFETPHPDTVFQIQGLEIVLQDEERKQEMEEMEASEKHGKKIDFSSQKEHLKSMEQLINIISPSTTQNSLLPAGYNGIEIIALTGVAILLVIRCGECLWLRKGNK